MIVITKRKMIAFTPFCLALVGMFCIVQGQSVKFMNGQLILTWTNIAQTRKVYLTTDLQSPRGNWIAVEDGKFIVENVLRYKIVYIDVQEDRRQSYRKTYKVNKIESNEGESTNISWTINKFPVSGRYMVFHRARNGSFLDVITILHNGKAYPTKRYVYYSNPINSKHIKFEVRNVTLADAGYYIGGTAKHGDFSAGEDAILVVHGKPEKPVIHGSNSVKLNTQASLKCESKSTSAPNYYKAFPSLTYYWYVNDTKKHRKRTKTYRFKVTKKVKYNRYSCQAIERLASERSEEIRINPLYGPESVIITPGNDTISINNGNPFGPYNCSADCNPPCTLQWKYKKPSGPFVNATSPGFSPVMFPQHSADRTRMTLILCEANNTEGYRNQSIGLDILYFLDPQVNINGNFKNSSTINEGRPLRLSCSVEGNPTPNITLKKLIGNKVIGKNYTLIREAQCSDTSAYSCEGKSSKFGSKNRSFSISVLCDPRPDSTFFITNYGSMSGPDVKVVVNVPVVANPSPSTSGIAWSGPTSQNISIKVSQRDNIVYKHWINSSIPVPDKRSFGNYSLKYNGKVFVDITINPQDKPQPPLNFTGYSYASEYINLTWISNFNGGPEQFFILSRKKGSSWTVVENLTDPGEGNLGHYDLGPLAPGQEYWYQLESCNRINCSLNPVKARVIVPALSTSSSIFNNPTMLIVIGSSVVVLVLIVILIVVTTMFFRKKKSVPQKRNSDAPEQDNTPPEAVEYAAVDKSLLMKNRQQADVTESDVIKEKNDDDETTYSEVIKNPNKPNQRDGKKEKKNGEKEELQGKTEEAGASNNDQETTYSEVIKTSNLPKQADGKKEKKKKKSEKKDLQGKKERAGSFNGNDETRTLNQDGLVYIDVEFAKKPSSSDTKGKPFIHGEEERTEYTFVDFSKKPPPTQETQDGVK